MPQATNLHPNIFCPLCSAYLATDSTCNCGWERPAAQYIPKKPSEARRQFNVSGEITARPLVTDNTVFIGSRGGFFYAFNRADGSLRWQEAIGNRVQTAAVLYRNTVIVGADDGAIYAFDAQTGEQAWDDPFQTGGKVQGGMALAKGVVYFGNHNGEIFALNAQTGAPLWQSPFQTRKLLPIKGSPTISNRILFIGGYDGELYAIDALRGTVNWHFDTDGRIAASPVATPNTVIVANLDGDICAFTHLGRELWHKTVPTGIHGTPALANGTLYFGTLDGNFYALKAKGTTEPRVIFRADKAIAGAPLIVDNLIFCGANDGNLYALTRDDERAFGRFHAGTALLAGPAFFNGELYIGGEKGTIFAVPWHLGEWANAANYCKNLGDDEGAAAFFALAGDKESALAVWRASDEPGRAAALLESLDEQPLETIAEEFERAARQLIRKNRVRAVVYLLRAADFYAEADMPEKEAACRSKAARLAPLPRLKIDVVNLPNFVEDEPGAIAFDIRNFGKGAAHNISVDLGGKLKHAVSFELAAPIQPVSRIRGIEIADILPTDTQLRVAISYTDRHGTPFHYHKLLEITLNRIDAGIVVGRDSAASIHIDGAGDAIPKVHIKEGGVLNLRVKKA